jgi:hypothetical protein
MRTAGGHALGSTGLGCLSTRSQLPSCASGPSDLCISKLADC